MQFKKLLLAIAIIWLIVVSIFPRSVEILNGNFIFLLDQGRDYLAVKDIVINHKPTLIGAEVGSGMAGLQGLFHGPFYFYLLSVPFVIFDGDPYGGLLLMFVFGIFGGFVMAFLIALSPPLIAQSRFVWSPHLSTFFILIAFYFTYLAYRKKNFHLFLAAFFTGFIYNFEFAIVFPMSLALVFYTLFLLRKELWRFIFVLGGFVVSYSPLLIFEMRHGFQALRGFGSYFSHPGTTIKIDFGAFLHNFSDTFSHQGLIPSLLILSIFIGGLIVFVLREKRNDMRYFISFLVLAWMITFLILSLVKTHIFEYYLIHLNIITIFLFSYIFICAYEKKHTSLQILFTTFFATFLFYGTANSIEITRKDFFDYGGMVKMRGKIDAIDYIYNDADGKRFGLLIFSPPIYTHPYDYLIWWYGQRKYNYLPHQEKSGLFYLLIEKDLSAPWTYQGWLQTVIKKGKVIKEVQLPSGFIIQKRISQDEKIQI